MSDFSPEWLELREDADAAGRAADLLGPLRGRLCGKSPLVIRDLGCGSGSMGRWLAGRLTGPQHWVLYDRDPTLLAHASARMVRVAADGAPVTVETRQADITALTADDLVGADLVTASALLDLLTGPEVDRLAAACVELDCPALLTLSVLGRVELGPAEPLDRQVESAFNAHQRREVDGRRLLGPDALDAATEAFTRYGAAIRVAPSPWRLGPADADLTEQWLRGWVGAATEHRPDVAVGGYLDRRLAAAGVGHLDVTVHHGDLLATVD
jgi:SAM-dependent methyltransferase